MRDEVLAWLAVKAGGTYVDATVGAGGHAAALLERAGPDGRLLGLDRDPVALATAGRRLAGFGARCVLRQARFSELPAAAAAAGIDAADGVLMDLGVSSMQLDDPARGFGFRAEGPLDMRMDPGSGETAADLVAGMEARELARLIREKGEEPAARRIAAAIATERARAPIATTTRLAGIVERAAGGRRGRRLHPATRTFQALRMAVNREEEELEAGIEAALALLRPGGRLAVIAFHSIEDRQVKHRFRAHAGRAVALQGGGVRMEGVAPRVRVLTPRPLRPGPAEVKANPRARSAKMRVAERMAEPW